MEIARKIGIWMDHVSANLMEFSNTVMLTKNVRSKFTHDVKEASLLKGESLMHNKEQQQQYQYYKKIADVLRNYDRVLLFGPTDAKTELFNNLRENNLFSNTRIDVLQSDKMTKNQQHAFVKKFFQMHI